MPDLPAQGQVEYDAPPVAADTPVVVNQTNVDGPALPVVARETKPGYLSTEFYLTLLTVVLTNLDVIPVPDKYQWVVTMVTVVGYAVARGLAKHGVPAVEAPKDK